ncbi:hypothetical protein SUGI_0842560 [Cryptomeria japonica]|uniref:uncharacterized protein LOC131052328 n=1 Tax=Cryptomeria japonica TaxID=3369 RepID=UPI0024147E05|nr:uncharacterized protein LOC131052328 [Cryptomeria japonica]GLJ40749.1 hypothetical protein SUGI_0842560 [Cryptomeria japonica]
MRSIWLYQSRDAVNILNSPNVGCFLSHYFKPRSSQRCSENIGLRIVSNQSFRRINASNLIRRRHISPAVDHLSPGQSDLRVKVFIISDLHTDYPENMAWIQGLSTVAYKRDVLIVAGDVAEKFENFILTMTALKERFMYVFFVPGNHDVWCRRKHEAYGDSVQKLSALLETCNALGVATEPKMINGVGIIPLFSWYHESFDKEIDITGFKIPSLKMACKDFHACKWPSTLSTSSLSLSRYFNELNYKHFDTIQEIKETSSQVITFSHFLPRQELCPEKRMLFYPNLPKVIGSDFLEVWVRKIHGLNGNQSACHVFGHTHFGWDCVLDGIRYIQAPLAYPRERKRRMNGGEDWLPFCIYDSENGGLYNELLPSYWSDYYRTQKRDPRNIELAPWVARFYKRIKSH